MAFFCWTGSQEPPICGIPFVLISVNFVLVVKTEVF
jgi:hypothetical protein